MRFRKRDTSSSSSSLPCAFECSDAAVAPVLVRLRLPLLASLPLLLAEEEEEEEEEEEAEEAEAAEEAETEEEEEEEAEEAEEAEGLGLDLDGAESDRKSAITLRRHSTCSRAAFTLRFACNSGF
jgi:hypothetical protein